MKPPRPADPEPIIVRLLRVVRWRSTLPESVVAQADAQIEHIVQAWIAREDPKELLSLLGLGPDQKKRRKQKTVNAESTMALQWLALVLEGQRGSDAKIDIALRFKKSVKTVERAIVEWHSMLVEVIGHPGNPEDRRLHATAELSKIGTPATQT
jgi:hypothetical protein